MRELRWLYKIIRTFLFTAIIVIGGLFVSLYILISIPPFQDRIRHIAERELTTFLGGEVSLGSLNIAPFNEVILRDIKIKDPTGIQCLAAGELGAGINFWKFIFTGEIEITYVDLLNFDISISQKEKDGPLNIDFIVKALQPKDKNKPPTLFDLKIHNVVLRNGSVSYSRLWMPKNNERNRIDFNYLTFDDINADITLPKVSNDLYEIDVRRLSLRETSGLDIKEISGFFTVTPKSLATKDLAICFPHTDLHVPNIRVNFSDFGRMSKILLSHNYNLAIRNWEITPSDFAAFYPYLERYDRPVNLTLDVKGTLDNLKINRFSIDIPQEQSSLSLAGRFLNLLVPEKLTFNLEDLDISLKSAFITEVMDMFVTDPKVNEMVRGAGDINASIKGIYYGQEKAATAKGILSTAYGDIDLHASAAIHHNMLDLKGRIAIPSFDFSALLDTEDFKNIANSEILFDVKNVGTDVGLIDGVVKANIGQIGLYARQFENIDLEAVKHDNHYRMNLTVADNDLDLSLDCDALYADSRSYLKLDADIKKFDTYTVFLTGDDKKYEVSGRIKADITGNSLDNIAGNVSLDDFRFSAPGVKPVSLDHLYVVSYFKDEGDRHIEVDSEIVDVTVDGNFNPLLLPAFAINEIRTAMPSLIPGEYKKIDCGYGSFNIDFADARQIIDLLKLKVEPLTEISFSGDFNSDDETINFSTRIPYIVHNDTKLIRDTYLKISVDGKQSLARIDLGSELPTAKGDLKIDVAASALSDHYNLDIDFNRDRNRSFYGEISLGGSIIKNYLGRGFDIDFNVNPTSLFLNDAEWKVGAAEVKYADSILSVEDFSIRHNDEFVLIDGVSSRDENQMVEVRLQDIDLSYIFDTLNINYVTFGGIATGEVMATELFSSNPQIRTKYLDVKNLSYNGAVLGDGKLSSNFDLPNKKVNIYADISEKDRRVAEVDGGVWIGRDSLAFNFKTDKVDIRFLKPFVKAFTSDIRGRATGDLLLYGTFRDINMKGRAFADEISMLVDYTNVRYYGSDTVYMEPGLIRMPDFHLRDKFGNTALLNGTVRHRYFHEPEFNFDITEVHDLLCYDTNAKINPVWYGTIFASGDARIEGKPGYVNIFADMQTRKNTLFTFVLSDELQAVESKFLTFSDRRKEMEEVVVEEVDTVPEFLKRFQRKIEEKEAGVPDVFSLDLRASVTPDAELDLIMDPAAGDKITAFGSGAMNITYNSHTDDMRIYGKYILDKGDYNFSLQDIILKDFTIKPGSSISFTGNPYAGDLDITAAYRVNTSLTELDKSFASDRELNRTNVPVEALLKVTGIMTNPDISFDIDLPTVTEETTRKVKSIISTDDMMNRQVIYLVALNKFYSPEYMGITSTGGEWASVASSTISSQIQNMIGQLTDKFTLAPSLRSDKGDFSDLEFDVALSSSLFNNRLLLNGNLGYRDRTTSNTTFVGDFDLEYLLTRNGNFRLKAYNHFNDQNYYLKSALTTQGLGIVWRKEFDNLNSIFGRGKKKEEKKGEAPDSVSSPK